MKKAIRSYFRINRPRVVLFCLILHPRKKIRRRPVSHAKQYPEAGEKLGPGQIARFCSKGYNTIKGYYKMPDVTKETVDVDGWLHSGDLCYLDEKGNCVVTGRLKDMIIRGGENIYPKEIEEFIMTLPAIRNGLK